MKKKEESDEIIYHFSEGSTIHKRRKNISIDYNNTRNKPTNWTSNEILDLKDGVKYYGLGAWKQILSDPKYKFQKNRTSTALKDKYRLLTKTTSYHQIQPKEFVFVDEENEIIKDALGNHTVYKERYPYVAAERIARFYGLGLKGVERFYVMDIAVPYYSHVYEAEVINEKLKVKKKKRLTLG